MDIFFILGILIERDFKVDFFGSVYIDKIDSCVCFEFFRECVVKLEIFKVMVWLLFLFSVNNW